MRLMTVFTSEETLVNRLREIDLELSAWASPDALHFGPVGRGRDLDVFARVAGFSLSGYPE